ncbi:hypothetical protein BCR44DRAFT_1495365 [Catenaria anguillulae PL171]|uniref:Uncharacterized protein n=1 Tax=Catenaria anguillulae PL171 TaxID=765915 RepID=A0A1Y2I1X6_9FUNG|nr:hypothetical protein BCR44DRAFT_1495365 [Catenaria anguillulae PL171]
MTDSAASVRLLLPDGKPARGLFPGLAADVDIPVFAACSFAPSSPADNARQNVEFDYQASTVAQGNSDSMWLYDARDALRAAARLNDCTLTHCTTEYWAAHGSLCIALDAPVLRNATLTQLPVNSPESLRQLHRDYLASRQGPAGNATSPTTTVDTLKLGICAPVPPIGIPCDPAPVNSDDSLRGSFGIPQIEPMPRSVILSRALPQGSTWPRVVEGIDPLPPVRHFQALPSELRVSSSRASVSLNLMALTTCNDNKLLAPAKNAGDACEKGSECRFVTAVYPTQGSMATHNLAVNFNSGPGSAPPMATTSVPPWSGSLSNNSGPFGGPMTAFLALVLALSFMMLLVGCSRRVAKAKPPQTEPRPLYASEVGGPTARSGNQRRSAQQPIDPDLDEPLPRYVP